jgi:hypothetical protein
MKRTINDGWALTRDLKEKHTAAVERKESRIAMYEGLIQMWEHQDCRDEDYLRDLRRRLRSEQTQLRVMKP